MIYIDPLTLLMTSMQGIEKRIQMCGKRLTCNGTHKLIHACSLGT